MDPTNLIVITLNVVLRNIVRNLSPTGRLRGRRRSGKTTKIEVIIAQHKRRDTTLNYVIILFPAFPLTTRNTCLMTNK